MAHTRGVSQDLIHWGRFFIAIFAILVAATHLSSLVSAGSGAPIGFQALGLWLDIEIVAYTIIAVVFLLGLRSWYMPSILFNAFNLGLYFLSGFIAIPGITSVAFGSRLGAFTHSLSSGILIISWLAVLVIGLLLLKHDPGSELDKLSRTHAKK